MRELSSIELSLVSGGYGECEGDDEECGIIVIGHPPYYPPSPPYYPPTPPYSPPPYYPPETGGGGGGTPSYADWQQQECLTDLGVDYAAWSVETMIKAQPDWAEREYGAVIYLVDGQIKIGPLTTGMTVAEAVAAGLDAPETRLTVPSDLGDGVILAVVHSHPDIGYTNAEDLENRYPSSYTRPDGTWGGDYAAFSALVGSDPRFANHAAFAQYILGPDGVMREFNAKDGIITRSNDTDPNSRSEFWHDRPCYN